MRGLFIVAIGLARTAGALSYNAPLSAVSRVSSPSMMAKSKALPFLEQPAHLDGSMAGDVCLLYTSPSPRDQRGSRMPSSA